jgi:glycosyltransferase involved in cell wall biosynthesis
MRTISVVLATYNSTRHLPAQLDSILGQTLQPAEIVVGDDGSTDHTLGMLEEFAQTARIPVRVVAGPREGHGSNFLNAAQHATGDRIAWADHDDVWLPEKLQRLSTAMEDAESVLAFHGVFTVDANLRPIRSGYPSSRRSSVWEPLTRNVWHTIPGNVMLFERFLLEGVDWASRPNEQWLPGVQMAHDDLAGLLGAIRGRIVRLPERLLLYRQTGENVVGAPDTGIPAGRLSGGSYISYVRQREDLAEVWAEWFSALVPPNRRSATAAYFRAAGRRQRRRAETLNAPGLSGLRLYATHALAGDYRTGTPDGLGWRALLRDGYFLARSNMSLQQDRRN